MSAMDMTTRRPRAVIFDMDGLMLDTEPLAARAWDDAAETLGVAFDRTLPPRLIGRNFTDCSAMIRAHYGDFADYPVDALLAHWHAAYDAIVTREGVATKPGVFELIDWLEARNIVRAVATSTRRDRAIRKLTHAALLPRFAVLVGGDEIARGKPAPDIYLAAARSLSAEPAECLALEDSFNGIRAAAAAGMPVVMVPDLAEPTPEIAALAVGVYPSLADVQRAMQAAWGEG